MPSLSSRLALCVLFLCSREAFAADIPANPSTYRMLLQKLKPGDTLNLVPGQYPRLSLSGINGTPDAWITITGPSAEIPAVIAGETGHNTIEILNCSYLSLQNLRIDSRGISGAFGISAKGREENVTHHIRIESNTFVGQNADQQTDGISTKTPTWGWIIRYNRILGAGTGIYLGDSNGTQPFVEGIIENNLIADTIGYNMEIKDQVQIPSVPGIPTGPTTTIIRNNVFIKNDQRSPDGDRPNLIVGAFPSSGPGALSSYDIYGNLFLHNHREALFQGSGRLSLHDNIFVDGPYGSPAIVLRRQNYPLKLVNIYNNTVYTAGRGIYFGTRAESGDEVVGNLIFAAAPISGAVTGQADNVVDSTEHASLYVKSPAFDLEKMDFSPLVGKCQGPPIDLSWFRADTDFARDFEGRPKTDAKGNAVFRGAYASEGSDPDWKLSRALKPPRAPSANSKASLVWVEPHAGPAGATVPVDLTGMNFAPGAELSISGAGISVASVKVVSEHQIAAILIIARGTTGVRSLTVKTSDGNSNPFVFQIKPR